MLSFAFKIASNATSLNVLLGYKKKGSFPLLIIKEKKPHPSPLIFHFFKQKFSSLHAHQSEIFKFFFKPKNFPSIPFFLVVGTLGLWGGGEGFVLVTSCCKRKFNLELLI
jgi:hypothetical protein